MPCIGTKLFLRFFDQLHSASTISSVSIWCNTDLCRGHLRVAQQICDEFGVLSSSVSGVDIELKTEASLRRARTLLAAKQFSQVFNLLVYSSLPNKHVLLILLVILFSTLQVDLYFSLTYLIFAGS